MKKLLFLLVIFVLLKPFSSKAQFVINDDASITTPECPDSATTYLLTPNLNNQDGEIWYNKQVSLASKFDIEFQMYLGSKSYSVGADGICFVFQQLSVTAGSSGGGLGYGGVTPSIAVEFDTYQNGWDPAYCHTAIEKNGDVNHTDLSGNNLAGPVQLDPSNPNLPDGLWHSMEIIWDPGTKTISVYYDCNLRLSYTGDIINNIFSGNPNVYWGFTAGTGGSDNNQEICIGHSYLNNLRDTTICSGDSVPLSVSGGVSYAWSPATGLSSDSSANIVARPDTTTKYVVSVTNSCGLISKDSVTISVNPFPHPSVTGNDSICAGDSTLLTVSAGKGSYYYNWSDGETSSSIEVSPASTKTYTIVAFNGSCIKDTTFTVYVKPNPTATITPKQTICQGNSTILTATGGGSYTWSNGATTSSITVNPTSNFSYAVVVDKNGCLDSAKTSVTVDIPTMIACCNDTIMVGDTVTIEASGQSNYSWEPVNGLSCTTCPNPVASPSVTTTYTVTGTDSNGCTIERTITIYVETPCSDFTVPNIFTPNDDGINDDFVVKVLNASSYSIAIYDRWGKKVYSSTDYKQYWSGRLNGTNYLVPDGVYYYIIKATCADNNYTKKGFVQVLGGK